MPWEPCLLQIGTRCSHLECRRLAKLYWLSYVVARIVLEALEYSTDEFYRDTAYVWLECEARVVFVWTIIAANIFFLYLLFNLEDCEREGLNFRQTSNVCCGLPAAAASVQFRGKAR